MSPMTEGEALAVLRELRELTWTCGMDSTHLVDHRETAALDAAIAALTAHTAASGGEVVAWQIRYIDPDEGPSTWGPLPEKHVAMMSERPDYEVRPLYTAPPAAVPADALRDELTRLRQMTCKCVENNTRMNASESRTKGLAQAAQRLLSSLSPGLPLNHKARAAVRELAALIPKGADHEQR
jgi:hypothetical protein